MISGSSSFTIAVDNIFLFILAISVALLIIITVTMIYFIVRYSRKKNPAPKNIESNILLEIIWVVIPTILVLAMFYYGWNGFRFMRTVPEDAMTIKATGRMWSWEFVYENGRKSTELMVPQNRPVRLVISSLDVIHSLYIPAFRVKQDAIPGVETQLWFLSDKKGSYDLFCSEYCGTGHSSMISKVIVMPQEDFDSWYADSGKTEVVKEGAAQLHGKKLLEDKGCLDCHTTDGDTLVGPTFKGLFGSIVVVVTGGKERKIAADEAYLKRSILEADSDIVKGFPNIMPPQKDNLSESELLEIITYLKGLK